MPPDPVDAQVLLAEYAALRAEIVQRAQIQALLVGANLALVVGLFQGVVGLFEGGVKADTRSLTVLLAAPVIFSLVASLHLEQDVSICQAASYLHRRLRPAMQRLSERPKDVMAWELYRHDALFATAWRTAWVRLRSVFRLLTLLGPGIACVAVAVALYATSKDFRDQVNTAASVLFVLDVVMVVSVSMYWQKVVGLYKKITSD